MGIGKLEKDDLKNALSMIWTIFEEFEAPDYSQEGVDSFRAFIDYTNIITKSDLRELSFWGYEIDSNWLV
jgi:hypothetical protein